MRNNVREQVLRNTLGSGWSWRPGGLMMAYIEKGPYCHIFTISWLKAGTFIFPTDLESLFPETRISSGNKAFLELEAKYF